MLRHSSNLCPNCRRALFVSCDMWGEFFVCDGCGFTAEDDDELVGARGRYSLQAVEEARALDAASAMTERRQIA